MTKVLAVRGFKALTEAEPPRGTRDLQGKGFQAEGWTSLCRCENQLASLSALHATGEAFPHTHTHTHNLQSPPLKWAVYSRCSSDMFTAAALTSPRPAFPPPPKDRARAPGSCVRKETNYPKFLTAKLSSLENLSPRIARMAFS